MGLGTSLLQAQAQTNTLSMCELRAQAGTNPQKSTRNMTSQPNFERLANGFSAVSEEIAKFPQVPVFKTAVQIMCWRGN